MNIPVEAGRLFSSRWSAIGLLVLLAAILMLRGLGDNSIGYPDADRILMDGVFLADTLRDMPLGDPWGYAQAYFVQYPGLSIGYRPPFFPAVEGIFNIVFGINMWSSRLALFAFIVVGIVYWFRLAENLAGRRVAFWSSALWISTPFLAQWAWYTMAELAVLSMSIAALYYLHRWVETEKLSDAVLMALFIGIAGWTKQTAAFLALVVFFYLLLKGRLFWAIKRPGHWGAFALLAAMTVPLALMTLAFGDMNVHQSVGPMSDGRAPRWSIDNWMIHVRSLIDQHLTLPVLLLGVVGLVAGVAARLRATLFPLLAILSVYVFFSLLVGKNSRYPIFWIPFWCFLAALPLMLPAMKRQLALGYQLLLGLVVLMQGYQLYERPLLYASGYDEAAQIALAEATSPGIFIDAHNNGYFTYFVRQADTDRSHYVFRGDKLLSSSSIATHIWQEVHVTSEEEIVDLFNQLAVSIIVVESLNYTQLPIHDTLRQMLKGPAFELVRAIDIDSNKVLTLVEGSPRLGDQQLLVYRYKNARQKMSGDISLRLPVVGTTIKQSLESGDKQ